MVELENYFLKIFETWCTPVEIRNCPAPAGRKDEKVKQTGIFKGRAEVLYNYGRFGWTRNYGKTWHGGIDIVGLDSDKIRMPYYNGKKTTGTVTRARIVTNRADKTWEWGWYVCVQLDAGQTPDTVNFLYFCHCAKLLVSVGQKVSSGDALGIMGNTGNAAGGYIHCHFEARATATGTGVDPTAYAGIDNAVGVYGTAEDGKTEQIRETPTGKTMQCLMIGPLDSAAAAKCDALADKLALASAGRYATLPGTDADKVKCVGAISNGDAVSFYQLAEAEGWTKDNKYMARYVG